MTLLPKRTVYAAIVWSVMLATLLAMPTIVLWPRPDPDMDLLSRVVEVNPDNSQAWSNRGAGWIQPQRMDPAKAIADADEALRHDPDNAHALEVRAKASFLRKDVPAAIADLESALLLDPDNPELLRMMAFSLALVEDPKLRDPARAVELATRACELTDWQNRYALVALGTACAANGDFEAAIERERQALKLTDEPLLQTYARGRIHQYELKRLPKYGAN